MILNAVAPGVMKTPVLAPETHEFLAELHPVGRMREIQDIVDAILFLENAAIITGRDSASSTMGQSAGQCQNGETAWAAAPTIEPTINDKASRRRPMPIVNIQITREGTLPEYTRVTREQKARLRTSWQAYAQPVENSRADCHSRLIRWPTARCSDFGNRSCRPTAVRMRANGTMCDPSDVDRLADGNQVVRLSMRTPWEQSRKSLSSPVPRRASARRL